MSSKTHDTVDNGKRSQFLRRKALFAEPVTSYFSGAYNTLISVVQGVALAALCSLVQKHLESSIPTDLFWWKAGVAFSVICVLWHRYIIENQNIAWRLGLFDTVIPMMFAALQVFLVAMIPKGPTELCFAYFLLFSWGAVAYINGVRRQKNPTTLRIYQTHFFDPQITGIGEGFGKKLWHLELQFQYKALKTTGGFAVLSLLVFWVGHGPFWTKSPLLGTAIVITFGFAAASYLFVMDLQRHLKSRHLLELTP